MKSLLPLRLSLLLLGDGGHLLQNSENSEENQIHQSRMLPSMGRKLRPLLPRQRRESAFSWHCWMASLHFGRFAWLLWEVEMIENDLIRANAAAEVRSQNVFDILAPREFCVKTARVAVCQHMTSRVNRTVDI